MGCRRRRRLAICYLLSMRNGRPRRTHRPNRCFAGCATKARAPLPCSGTASASGWSRRADALEPIPASDVGPVQGAYSHNGLAQKFDGQTWICRKSSPRKARLGNDHHHAPEKRLGCGIAFSARAIEHDGCRVRRRERRTGGQAKTARSDAEAKGWRGLADLTDDRTAHNFVDGKIYNLKDEPVNQRHRISEATSRLAA